MAEVTPKGLRSQVIKGARPRQKSWKNDEKDIELLKGQQESEEQIQLREKGDLNGHFQGKKRISPATKTKGSRESCRKKRGGPIAEREVETGGVRKKPIPSKKKQKNQDRGRGTF